MAEEEGIHEVSNHWKCWLWQMQNWFCHPPVPGVSRPGSCREQVCDPSPGIFFCSWVKNPKEFSLSEILKDCRELGKVRGSKVP